MGTPLISVAMCLFNSRRYIDETMESLLAQTWHDFEAILVDDGSSDGTADHIALHFPDPRITIFRQPNGGMGNARSASVLQTKGEYVAFLDHDDLWFPEKLERQMAMAAQNPDAALIFSDALRIDSNGRILDQVSGQYEYHSIDLRAAYAHDELLRRGCFITLSTAMVKRSELMKFGGPDAKVKFGDDYRMWLRLSRNHPVLYVDEVLAKWRIHPTSITEKHPEISVREHSRIWAPVIGNATYPAPLRNTVADHLFGQQRAAIRTMIRSHRPMLAARIVAEALMHPGAIVRFTKDRIRQALPESVFLLPFRLAGIGRTAILSSIHFVEDLFLRIKDFISTLPKRIRGQSWSTFRSEDSRMRVWIDGTSLTSLRAGYFNFVCETIRSLARDGRFVVHVSVPRGGKSILCEQLGTDSSQLNFHDARWQQYHWSSLYHVLKNRWIHFLFALFSVIVLVAGIMIGSRGFIVVGFILSVLEGIWSLHEWFARKGRDSNEWAVAAARFAWKLLGYPWRSAPAGKTSEIIIWHGRFRFANSRKIAVVHDVTAHVRPDLHTPGNVIEFEEFVSYSQRHADVIATVSEYSRRDIVQHLDFRPNSVRVVKSLIHPAYMAPQFDQRALIRYQLNEPYLLCVGAIEPRKNLRRLVEAFSLLKQAGALREHVLAIAGPQGWDTSFDQFLAESNNPRHVRRLGFVPVEHMPSLYHFASAFIYPSVYEGFGLPVLEAMCCSSVVLTSNVTSLAEIAGDEVRTFDPLEATSIAESILMASVMTPDANAEYREKCLARGRRLLCESLDRPSMATLLANGSVEERCASPLYSHSLI